VSRKSGATRLSLGAGGTHGTLYSRGALFTFYVDSRSGTTAGRVRLWVRLGLSISLSIGSDKGKETQIQT